MLDVRYHQNIQHVFVLFFNGGVPGCRYLFFKNVYQILKQDL